MIILSVIIIYFSVYRQDGGESEVIYEQKLEGVRSSKEAYGGGNLFTFVIQSSDNYIGWRKKDGGLQKFSMPQSSIVYEKSIDFGYYQKKCKFSHYLWHEYEDSCHSEIHVPKGTVKLEYNIK